MRLSLDVAALGISQIVGYGTLYYSFGVLAPAMARDFAWANEWVFGALSISLLASGLVAPMAGRWMDRLGAGPVMAAGSIAAALALTLCAMATSGAAFVPALIAVEIASTLVQYGAAFSLLVQRQPLTAQRNIVYLTLFAGFASTIFWPLTSWLHGFLNWRQVYMVFAAFQLLICLPIHVWLARRPPSPAPAGQPRQASTQAGARNGDLAPDDRRRGFVLMTAALASLSFISSAVLMHMLPMLDAIGLGAIAVAVSASFGPSQVISRLLNMLFARNLAQTWLSVISAAALGGGLVMLALTAPAPWGAVAFAAIFGVGSGLFSIIGGALPLELFGHQGYGALQGRLMSVRLIVGATAPFAFASMSQNFGPRIALLLTSATGAFAVLALLRLVALRKRGRTQIAS